MRVRALLPTAAVCAVAAALVPAGGAGAAASRPSTPQDLEGTRAPAMLRDHGLDTQEEPLIVGTRYRVVVVQELAIGDHARPVDGSIVVSAPNGPTLQQTTENDRPAYDFTPDHAGTQRLAVSWEEEVGEPGSGDVCAASQSFDLPVLQPTVPEVEGRFRRGGSQIGSTFILRLRGKAPQDPAKVSVILRTRRGTTKPPPARGRAFARFTFTPTGDGDFESLLATRQLRHILEADAGKDDVTIYPYNNVAFGRTLRFAFSFEVIQNGKRIGGMRSGAICRRVQFTGHSAMKCKAVGLKQSP